MDEEIISEGSKYVVSFETRFIVQAKNYDEAMEKMKSEMIKKMNDPDSNNTNLSVQLISTTDNEEHELSYHDDWDFDDRW